MNWIQGKRKEITNNNENAKQLNQLNQSTPEICIARCVRACRVYTNIKTDFRPILYWLRHRNFHKLFYICAFVCVGPFFLYCSFTLQSQFSCNSESTIRDEFYCEWTHTYIHECILITYGFQKSRELYSKLASNLLFDFFSLVVVFISN